MSSIPPPAPSNKLLSVLSLLEAYSQVHEKGQNDQKASTWQLTVARHNKGRHGALINGVLLADDVREELRAMKVLRNPSTISNPDEPLLLGEDTKEDDDGEEKSDASKKNKSTTTKEETLALQRPERIFVLEDSMERKAKNHKEEDEKSGDDTDTTGLRRRRGGGNTGTNDDDDDQQQQQQQQQQKWSVEFNEDEEGKSEEERLRNANPLDLFGAMPPKELRKAQQEAQKALEYYVEAANLVAAIQEQMK